MSEFGDPEYFRQPAPLDSHLVDLDYPTRQKKEALHHQYSQHREARSSGPQINEKTSRD